MRAITVVFVCINKRGTLSMHVAPFHDKTLYCLGHHHIHETKAIGKIMTDKLIYYLFLMMVICAGAENLLLLSLLANSI